MLKESAISYIIKTMRLISSSEAGEGGLVSIIKAVTCSSKQASMIGDDSLLYLKTFFSIQ
jgi:hypothetical protein